MDVWHMREHHVTDVAMCTAAQWRTVEDQVARLPLQWLGRAARAPTRRAPKQVLFGFASCRGGGVEEHANPSGQIPWLRRCMRK
eukprot:9483543-Pyramimonas_sp.AAC.1